MHSLDTALLDAAIRELPNGDSPRCAKRPPASYALVDCQHRRTRRGATRTSRRQSS